MTGVAEEDCCCLMDLEGMADKALSRDSLLDNTPATGRQCYHRRRLRARMGRKKRWFWAKTSGGSWDLSVARVDSELLVVLLSKLSDVEGNTLGRPHSPEARSSLKERLRMGLYAVKSP